MRYITSRIHICVQHGVVYGVVQVTRLNVIRRYALGCVVIENIKNTIRHAQRHRHHTATAAVSIERKSKTSNSLWIPRVTAARQAPKRKHKINQNETITEKVDYCCNKWREIETILQFISKHSNSAENVLSCFNLLPSNFHESVWVSKWWRKLRAVRASSQLTKINNKLKQNRNERRNWLPSTNPHL